MNSKAKLQKEQDGRYWRQTMDSRKAFELILLMAKTTTIAKTKNGQEAIEIAEDYMEYWGEYDQRKSDVHKERQD